MSTNRGCWIVFWFIVFWPVAVIMLFNTPRPADYTPQPQQHYRRQPQQQGRLPSVASVITVIILIAIAIALASQQ